MSNIWYIWLILGALFIVAEIFTTGFVLLWFGIGALVAALLALTCHKAPMKISTQSHKCEELILIARDRPAQKTWLPV